ncbi:MAG: ferritin-like domain-containing protein [Pseudomonadota bacterium]|nr:ferritin-like domain-containing protein [Pseudomonadota bacterium]
MTAKSSDKTLKDLFVHALKDIYYAEKAILKALPKAIEHAKHAELKQALTAHMGETRGHVDRLEDVFGEFAMKPLAVKCEAIEGILKEGDEVIGGFDASPAGDAAIIFACQAIEHYEINRYGTLLEWAKELKMNSVAQTLKATLEEERAADRKLTALAESGENRAARAA